jgi:hypothetical protein
LLPNQIDYLLCDTKPLPEIDRPNDLQSLQLSKLLLEFQQHAWEHTKSCFKISRRTSNANMCRFLKPEKLIEASKFIDQYRFQLKRKLGHEYMNTFSILIAQLFRCNHDVKILRGAQAFNTVYYALKYSTKAQEQFENFVLLHVNALNKADEAQRRRYSDPPNCDSYDSSSISEKAKRGRSRIMSMVRQLTAPQEIGAPIACLYLMNQTPFYWSHSFVNLYFSQTLKLLLNESTIPVTAVSTLIDCKAFSQI